MRPIVAEGLELLRLPKRSVVERPVVGPVDAERLPLPMLGMGWPPLPLMRQPLDWVVLCDTIAASISAAAFGRLYHVECQQT